MLVEVHYFPCILYWAEALRVGSLTLEKEENYQKKSYRNKCKILSVNKVLTLSIPLQKGKHANTKIQAVKIIDDDGWKGRHLQSIRSAYGNAPYFEFYWDDIERLILQATSSIFDLNVSIIQYFARLFGIKIYFTEEYKKDAQSDDKRHQILPKINIDHFPNYDQVFAEKHDFVQNLSILDLLFCLGPEAGIYLRTCDTSKVFS